MTCLGVDVPHDLTCTGVSIDSRTIQPGELYIAIVGESLDGHDFVADAFMRGASAAVVSESSGDEAGPLLQVADTTHALGQIAAFHRQRFDLAVIALTGSCGKTTVKEMVASILSLDGNTLATPGNFNNHIGVPLSLMMLDDSHQSAVFELGANHIGEIAYTSALVCPDVALVNNVSAAHLEGFGSIAGVAKAKGEIYDSLTDDGVAIVNADEVQVNSWQKNLENRKTLTFSREQQADVMATAIQLDANGCPSFELDIFGECQRIHLGIPGMHNVSNALAAAASCHALNVSLSKIKQGLERCASAPGRMTVTTGLAGARLIDDSYNANFASVKAAIEVLAAYPSDRILVLGDMAELGQEAEHHHRELGKLASAHGVDMMLTCGHLSRFCSDAFEGDAKHFTQQSDLLAYLKPKLNSQTTLIIKGSRSAHMERVVEGLMS